MAGFTSRWGAPAPASDDGIETSLRVVTKGFAAYQRLFVEGGLAPLLSRPNPLRYDDFDMDLVVKGIETEAEDVVSLTLAAESCRCGIRVHTLMCSCPRAASVSIHCAVIRPIATGTGSRSA